MPGPFGRQCFSEGIWGRFFFIRIWWREWRFLLGLSPVLTVFSLALNCAEDQERDSGAYLKFNVGGRRKR